MISIIHSLSRWTCYLTAKNWTLHNPFHLSLWRKGWIEGKRILWFGDWSVKEIDIFVRWAIIAQFYEVSLIFRSKFDCNHFRYYPFEKWKDGEYGSKCMLCIHVTSYTISKFIIADSVIYHSQFINCHLKILKWKSS